MPDGDTVYVHEHTRRHLFREPFIRKTRPEVGDPVMHEGTEYVITRVGWSGQDFEVLVVEDEGPYPEVKIL